MMPKVFIVYDSETGNTEKMANIVEEGVAEVESEEAVVKRAKNTTNEDLLETEGSIAGL